MPTLRRTLLLFAAFTVSSFATTITFQGPFGPGHDSAVIGDPLVFDIQDASISQPTGPGSPWTLIVDTNYGTNLNGLTGSLPGFADGSGSLAYNISDFLIKQGNMAYGIVLHDHDGYTAGNLYGLTVVSGTGFVNAPHFNTQYPVFLAPGGSLIATGSVSAIANPGGDGVHLAEYKITVNFNAPSTFLDSAPFTIYMSSADCANSFMTGDGQFGSPVPEPRTWMLVAPALLLLGLFARRLRPRTEN